MILGTLVGRWRASIKSRSALIAPPWKNSAIRQSLWDEVVFPKGTVRVEAELAELEGGLPTPEGVAILKLVWPVTRL